MTDLVRVAGRTIEGFDRFPSLYEAFRKPKQIALNHFVFNFSGSALDNSIWSLHDLQGTGTVGMVDAVDEGVELACGSGTLDNSLVDFNDIMHYDEDGSELIAVTRRPNGAARTEVGFKNTRVNYSSSKEFVSYADWVDQGAGKVEMRSGTSGGQVFNTTAVADNTDWTLSKIKLNGVTMELHLNGVLALTVGASSGPTLRLQPYFKVQNLTSSPRQTRIRYIEAYNT